MGKMNCVWSEKKKIFVLIIVDVVNEPVIQINCLQLDDSVLEERPKSK